MRKINNAGLNLIKNAEGFSPIPYYCSGGILTIGYGSTGSHVKPGMHISKAEADMFLMRDLHDAESAVSRLITRKLNDNQYAALVSFTFNLGSGKLQASTLRRKCNDGFDEEVATEFLKWVFGGGRRLSGLVKRRRAEADLYQA